MATKLYVGSLAYSVNDDELKAAFEQCGTVTSAVVIKDRQTDRSKGFGFVEMGSEEEAKKAVDTMNGQELSGRTIVVNEARPMEERPSRPSYN